jgi:hypothetical protein
MVRQNFIAKISDIAKSTLKTITTIGTFGSNGFEVEKNGNDFFYSRWGTNHTFSRRTLKYILEIGMVQNPVVFGILNKIALTSKNIELVPYRNGKPIKTKSLDLDISLAVMNLISTGTCVIHRVKPIGFPDYEYDILDTTGIVEEYSNVGFKYSYCKNGITTPIAVDDLLFITIYKVPYDITNLGLSPLIAATMPIEAMREMYIADASLLKNKGADGMITNDSDAPLLEDEVNGFDKDMNTRISGARNFGRIPTSTARLRFVQFGRTTKELALWEGYKIKTRDIANALMVKSEVLNDPESSTYSNVTEAQKAFYTEAVIPFVRLITDNKQLLRWLGHEIFIDTTNIECLQQSQKERFEKNKIITDAVILLNAEISKGVITKEIAVKILVQEWGYDEEEATELFMQNNISQIQ